jgi:hypothetical protein
MAERVWWKTPRNLFTVTFRLEAAAS